MTTLTFIEAPRTSLKTLVLSLLHRHRPVVRHGDQEIDVATWHAVRNLPPHLVRDIGLTDF